MWDQSASKMMCMAQWAQAPKPLGLESTKLHFSMGAQTYAKIVMAMELLIISPDAGATDVTQIMIMKHMLHKLEEMLKSP